MAKIDLRAATGLSIAYENEELTFKNVDYSEKVVVDIDSIREQLLNKN